MVNRRLLFSRKVGWFKATSPQIKCTNRGWVQNAITQQDLSTPPNCFEMGINISLLKTVSSGGRLMTLYGDDGFKFPTSRSILVPLPCF